MGDGLYMGLIGGVNFRFGVDSTALGILLGLLLGDGAGSAMTASSFMPRKALSKENSREADSSPGRPGGCLKGEMSRFDICTIVDGAGEMGLKGPLNKGFIRLDLGSSFGCMRFVIAVAGLVAAMWFRSLAKAVLGLARPDTDCADDGRMPDPTLAEKEEFDVTLELDELLRYDCDD